MATSSKDLETLWKRYAEEGSKQGISVLRYFESNGIPYHVFEKRVQEEIQTARHSRVFCEFGTRSYPYTAGRKHRISSDKTDRFTAVKRVDGLLHYPLLEQRFEARAPQAQL